MKTGCRLAAALALVALAVSTPAVMHGQAQTRAMYVTVLDDKGVPVPDLGPADFIVREDKMAREVLRVAPATDPIQIAVLVDTSQSAERFIGDYRQALPGFIDQLLSEEAGGKNEVAVIGIGERPTVLADYTRNRTQLTAAVNRLFAIHGSGTYLLDGLIEVSKGLTKRKAARAVIVAITSEGPELSERYHQTVTEAVRDSGATLHVIAIGQPVNTDDDRSIALSVGTHDSGGRYDNLLVPSALGTRLKEVATEITGQYRVTYSRPETLIPPEKVSVDTNRPKLTTRGIPVNEPVSRPPDRGRED